MSKHFEENGVGCKKRLCSFSGLDEVTTNDDLLIEILLWLPAKSLTRFKLVGKHWSSLIATHRFSHLHALRHPKPQHSVLLRHMKSQLFYFCPTSLHDGGKLVPFDVTIPNTKILSSCNELFLLRTITNTRIKEYYVYYLTTMQSRKISLTDNHDYPRVWGVKLAYDPSKSPHYKIVCIRTADITRDLFIQGLPRLCLVELYDSETLTWRSYLHPEMLDGWITKVCKFRNGVHWNNVIFWGNQTLNHYYYYDIKKNMFGCLPLAQIPRHESGLSASLLARCYSQLLESDGRLYQIIRISSLEEKSITVYELKVDYAQWLFLYHDVFDQPLHDTCILNFVREDGEQASALVVFHVFGKIIAYRFCDRSFTELVDFRNKPFYKENSISV